MNRCPPTDIKGYIQYLQDDNLYYVAGRVRGIQSALETGHIDQAKRLQGVLVGECEAEGYKELALSVKMLRI